MPAGAIVRRQKPSARDVASAAERLRRKLLGVDVGSLGLSPYMTRYLTGVLAADVARLSVYEHLLELGLDGWRARESLVIDYGGGHGVFSLLAREFGVGTVIYADVFAGAQADAEKLAAAVDLRADRYVVGDASALRQELLHAAGASMVICSNDVIEHIYDVDEHLDDLTALSSHRLRVVMASEANGANPRIRRRTMRMQRDVESRDRPPNPDDRPLDSVRAFRKLRAEMIADVAPGIEAPDVDKLATLTRGLVRGDVERAAVAYASDGVWPEPPAHPTNTCDPVTGNWAERLMAPSSLVSKFEQRGWTARAGPGRYSAFPGLKGRIANVLNRVVGIIGPLGVVIAPYYVVVANRHPAPLASNDAWPVPSEPVDQAS